MSASTTTTSVLPPIVAKQATPSDAALSSYGVLHHRRGRMGDDATGGPRTTRGGDDYRPSNPTVALALDTLLRRTGYEPSPIVASARRSLSHAATSSTHHSRLTPSTPPQAADVSVPRASSMGPTGTTGFTTRTALLAASLCEDALHTTADAGSLTPRPPRQQDRDGSNGDHPLAQTARRAPAPPSTAPLAHSTRSASSSASRLLQQGHHRMAPRTDNYVVDDDLMNCRVGTTTIPTTCDDAAGLLRGTSNDGMRQKATPPATAATTTTTTTQSGVPIAQLLAQRSKTKSLLRNVSEVKNLPALEYFETDLRGLVASNETRCRSTLELRRLVDSGHVTERASVVHEELGARKKIRDTEAEAHQSLVERPLKAICDESAQRSTIESGAIPFTADPLVAAAYATLVSSLMNRNESSQRLVLLRQEAVIFGEMSDRHSFLRLLRPQWQRGFDELTLAFRFHAAQLDTEQRMRLEVETTEWAHRDDLEHELLHRLVSLCLDEMSARRAVKWTDHVGRELHDRLSIAADEQHAFRRLVVREGDARVVLAAALHQRGVTDAERRGRQLLNHLCQTDLLAIVTGMSADYQRLHNALSDIRLVVEDAEKYERFGRQDVSAAERREFTDLVVGERRHYHHVLGHQIQRRNVLEAYIDGRLAVGRIEADQRDSLERHALLILRKHRAFEERSRAVVRLELDEEMSRWGVQLDAWEMFIEGERLHMIGAVDAIQYAELTDIVNQESQDRRGIYFSFGAAASGDTAASLEQQPEQTAADAASPARWVASKIDDLGRREDVDRALIHDDSVVQHGALMALFDAILDDENELAALLRSDGEPEDEHAADRHKRRQQRPSSASHPYSRASLEAHLTTRESKTRQWLGRQESDERHWLQRVTLQDAERVGRRHFMTHDESDHRRLLYLFVIELTEELVRDDFIWECADVLWGIEETRLSQVEAIVRQIDIVDMETDSRNLISAMREAPLPATMFLGNLEGDELGIRENIAFEAEVAANALRDYFGYAAPTAMLPNPRRSPISYSVIAGTAYERETARGRYFLGERSLMEKIAEWLEKVNTEEEPDGRRLIGLREWSARELLAVYMGEIELRQHHGEFHDSQRDLIEGAFHRIRRAIHAQEILRGVGVPLAHLETSARDGLWIESRAAMLGLFDDMLEHHAQVENRVGLYDCHDAALKGRDTIDNEEASARRQCIMEELDHRALKQDETEERQRRERDFDRFMHRVAKATVHASSDPSLEEGVKRKQRPPTGVLPAGQAHGGQEEEEPRNDGLPPQILADAETISHSAKSPLSSKTGRRSAVVAGIEVAPLGRRTWRCKLSLQGDRLALDCCERRAGGGKDTLFLVEPAADASDAQALRQGAGYARMASVYLSRPVYWYCEIPPSHWAESTVGDGESPGLAKSTGPANDVTPASSYGAFLQTNHPKLARMQVQLCRLACDAEENGDDTNATKDAATTAWNRLPVLTLDDARLHFLVQYSSTISGTEADCSSQAKQPTIAASSGDQLEPNFSSAVPAVCVSVTPRSAAEAQRRARRSVRLGSQRATSAAISISTTTASEPFADGWLNAAQMMMCVPNEGVERVVGNDDLARSECALFFGTTKFPQAKETPSPGEAVPARETVPDRICFVNPSDADLAERLDRDVRERRRNIDLGMTTIVAASSSPTANVNNNRHHDQGNTTGSPHPHPTTVDTKAATGAMATLRFNQGKLPPMEVTLAGRSFFGRNHAAVGDDRASPDGRQPDASAAPTAAAYDATVPGAAPDFEGVPASLFELPRLTEISSSKSTLSTIAFVPRVDRLTSAAAHSVSAHGVLGPQHQQFTLVYANLGFVRIALRSAPFRGLVCRFDEKESPVEARIDALRAGDTRADWGMRCVAAVRPMPQSGKTDVVTDAEMGATPRIVWSMSTSSALPSCSSPSPGAAPDPVPFYLYPRDRPHLALAVDGSLVRVSCDNALGPDGTHDDQGAAPVTTPRTDVADDADRADAPPIALLVLLPAAAAEEWVSTASDRGRRRNAILATIPLDHVDSCIELCPALYVPPQEQAQPPTGVDTTVQGELPAEGELSPPTKAYTPMVVADHVHWLSRVCIPLAETGVAVTALPDRRDAAVQLAKCQLSIEVDAQRFLARFVRHEVSGRDDREGTSRDRVWVLGLEVAASGTDGSISLSWTLDDIQADHSMRHAAGSGPSGTPWFEVTLVSDMPFTPVEESDVSAFVLRCQPSPLLPDAAGAVGSTLPEPLYYMLRLLPRPQLVPSPAWPLTATDPAVASCALVALSAATVERHLSRQAASRDAHVTEEQRRRTDVEGDADNEYRTIHDAAAVERFQLLAAMLRGIEGDEREARRLVDKDETTESIHVESLHKSDRERIAKNMAAREDLVHEEGRYRRDLYGTHQQPAWTLLLDDCVRGVLAIHAQERAALQEVEQYERQGRNHDERNARSDVERQWSEMQTELDKQAKQRAELEDEEQRCREWAEADDVSSTTSPSSSSSVTMEERRDRQQLWQSYEADFVSAQLAERATFESEGQQAAYAVAVDEYEDRQLIGVAEAQSKERAQKETDARHHREKIAQLKERVQADQALEREKAQKEEKAAWRNMNDRFSHSLADLVQSLKERLAAQEDATRAKRQDDEAAARRGLLNDEREHRDDIDRRELAERARRAHARMALEEEEAVARKAFEADQEAPERSKLQRKLDDGTSRIRSFELEMAERRREVIRQQLTDLQRNEESAREGALLGRLEAEERHQLSENEVASRIDVMRTICERDEKSDRARVMSDEDRERSQLSVDADQARAGALVSTVVADEAKERDARERDEVADRENSLQPMARTTAALLDELDRKQRQQRAKRNADLDLVLGADDVNDGDLRRTGPWEIALQSSPHHRVVTVLWKNGAPSLQPLKELADDTPPGRPNRTLALTLATRPALDTPAVPACSFYIIPDDRTGYVHLVPYMEAKDASEDPLGSSQSSATFAGPQPDTEGRQAAWAVVVPPPDEASGAGEVPSGAPILTLVRGARGEAALSNFELVVVNPTQKTFVLSPRMYPDLVVDVAPNCRRANLPAEERLVVPQWAVPDDAMCVHDARCLRLCPRDDSRFSDFTIHSRYASDEKARLDLAFNEIVQRRRRANESAFTPRVDELTFEIAPSMCPRLRLAVLPPPLQKADSSASLSGSVTSGAGDPFLPTQLRVSLREQLFTVSQQFCAVADDADARVQLVPLGSLEGGATSTRADTSNTSPSRRSRGAGSPLRSLGGGSPFARVTSTTPNGGADSSRNLLADVEQQESINPTSDDRLESTARVIAVHPLTMARKGSRRKAAAVSFTNGTHGGGANPYANLPEARGTHFVAARPSAIQEHERFANELTGFEWMLQPSAVGSDEKGAAPVMQPMNSTASLLGQSRGGPLSQSQKPARRYDNFLIAIPQFAVVGEKYRYVQIADEDDLTPIDLLVPVGGAPPSRDVIQRLVLITTALKAEATEFVVFESEEAQMDAEAEAERQLREEQARLEAAVVAAAKAAREKDRKRRRKNLADSKLAEKLSLAKPADGRALCFEIQPASQPKLRLTSKQQEVDDGGGGGTSMTSKALAFERRGDDASLAQQFVLTEDDDGFLVVSQPLQNDTDLLFARCDIVSIADTTRAAMVACPVSATLQQRQDFAATFGRFEVILTSAEEGNLDGNATFMLESASKPGFLLEATLDRHDVVLTVVSDSEATNFCEFRVVSSDDAQAEADVAKADRELNDLQAKEQEEKKRRAKRLEAANNLLGADIESYTDTFEIAPAVDPSQRLTCASNLASGDLFIGPRITPSIETQKYFVMLDADGFISITPFHSPTSRVDVSSDGNLIRIAIESSSRYEISAGTSVAGSVMLLSEQHPGRTVEAQLDASFHASDASKVVADAALLHPMHLTPVNEFSNFCEWKFIRRTECDAEDEKHRQELESAEGQRRDEVEAEANLAKKKQEAKRRKQLILDLLGNLDQYTDTFELCPATAPQLRLACATETDDTELVVVPRTGLDTQQFFIVDDDDGYITITTWHAPASRIDADGTTDAVRVSSHVEGGRFEIIKGEANGVVMLEPANRPHFLVEVTLDSEPKRVKLVGEMQASNFCEFFLVKRADADSEADRQRQALESAERARLEGDLAKQAQEKKDADRKRRKENVLNMLGDLDKYTDTFEIAPAGVSTLRLACAAETDDTELVVVPRTGHDTQQFFIVDDDDGYITITTWHAPASRIDADGTTDAVRVSSHVEGGRFEIIKGEANGVVMLEPANRPHFLVEVTLDSEPKRVKLVGEMQASNFCEFFLVKRADADSEADRQRQALESAERARLEGDLAKQAQEKKDADRKRRKENVLNMLGDLDKYTDTFEIAPAGVSTLRLACAAETDDTELVVVPRTGHATQQFFIVDDDDGYITITTWHAPASRIDANDANKTVRVSPHADASGGRFELIKGENGSAMLEPAAIPGSMLELTLDAKPKGIKLVSEMEASNFCELKFIRRADADAEADRQRQALESAERARREEEDAKRLAAKQAADKKRRKEAVASVLGDLDAYTDTFEIAPATAVHLRLTCLSEEDTSGLHVVPRTGHDTQQFFIVDDDDGYITITTWHAPASRVAVDDGEVAIKAMSESRFEIVLGEPKSPPGSVPKSQTVMLEPSRRPGFFVECLLDAPGSTKALRIVSENDASNFCEWLLIKRADADLAATKDNHLVVAEERNVAATECFGTTIDDFTEPWEFAPAVDLAVRMSFVPKDKAVLKARAAAGDTSDKFIVIRAPITARGGSKSGTEDPTGCVCLVPASDTSRRLVAPPVADLFSTPCSLKKVKSDTDHFRSCFIVRSIDAHPVTTGKSKMRLSPLADPATVLELRLDGEFPQLYCVPDVEIEAGFCDILAVKGSVADAEAYEEEQARLKPVQSSTKLTAKEKAVNRRRKTLAHLFGNLDAMEPYTFTPAASPEHRLTLNTATRAVTISKAVAGLSQQVFIVTRAEGYVSIISAAQDTNLALTLPVDAAMGRDGAVGFAPPSSSVVGVSFQLAPAVPSDLRQQFEAVRLDNRSLSLVPRLIPSVLLEASLDKGVSTTTGDALDTVYPVSCVDETEASNFCEFKAVKAT